MYESWFGFTKRPFVAAPQVDGYLPAEVNESALQALIWCVERGAGPGVVIGATGTGKTTLSLMIQQYFKSLMPVAMISGGACKTSRALLQNMLYAYSLPYEDSDEGQLRLSLTEFFRSRADGRGSLLILDEADKLDEAKLEEVRTFADLTGESGYAVHVVLVGSPRLEERLAMPTLGALNQRVATRCYLSTWNGEETMTYVQRQLHAAGAGDAVPFNLAALQQIADCTGGVPRLVNQLCDHALMLAATAGVHELDAAGIEEAWADLQNLPAPAQTSAATFENATSDSILEFGTLDGVEEPTDEVDANATSGPEASRFQPDLSDFEPFEDELEDTQDADADWLEDSPQVTTELTPESGIMAAASAVLTQEDASIHATELEEDLSMVSQVASTNPFLEEFESEEIVIRRVIRICDESTVLTDNVRTDEGQALASVLNLIDMTKSVSSREESPSVQCQVEAENQLAMSTPDRMSVEEISVEQFAEFAAQEGLDEQVQFDDAPATLLEQIAATEQPQISMESVIVTGSVVDKPTYVEETPLSYDEVATSMADVAECDHSEPEVTIRADEPDTSAIEKSTQSPKRFGRLFTRLSQQ